MRTTRPNPEIPDILRSIERGTGDLLAETDHTRRIGHARILMAHLTMLCDSPEVIVQIEELTEAEVAASTGPAGAGAGESGGPGAGSNEPGRPGAWLRADDFDRETPPFTGAWPFDLPGDLEGVFVQFVGDLLSPCYAPGPLDPYRTGPTNCGSLLYALELLHVVETPTTHRIVDPQIVDRARGRDGEGDAPFWILLDPAGRAAGVPAVAGRRRTRAGAVKRARALAEEWGVRTLVARVAMRWDAH